MSINSDIIIGPRITESTPVIVTASKNEIVSVDEFRNFQRTKTNNRTDQDEVPDFYEQVIAAATEMVQNYTGRSLLTQAWRWKIDRFPNNREVRIPRPPLISITNVVLIDADDVGTNMPSADYDVDTDNEPGLLYINENSAGVTTKTFRGIRIEYQAGYGSTGTSVPLAIKHAIMMWAKRIVEGRPGGNSRPNEPTPSVPDEVASILSQYVVRW